MRLKSVRTADTGAVAAIGSKSMKKALLSTFLLCFLAIGTAVAGNDDSVKVAGRVTVKPYGFVRNYFNYDSRKTVTVCGGEYLLVPYDEDWNITPEEETAIAGTLLPDGGLLRYDRNAVPQSHFQALSSRIGLALSGPALLGASTSGRLEGDFAGFGTSNTVLRLRLAYMRTDWHNDNNVIWRGDNTDKTHVFRIAYDGDTEWGFTLWRDGELIGQNLSNFATNGD